MLARRGVMCWVVALVLVATVSVSQANPHRFGDRPPTPDEQAYIYAVYTEVDRIEPNELAQARERAEIAAALRRGDTAPPMDGLPTAVDNSTLAYFPPIGDQGNQGSCTAWATGYYYNTYTQAMDADHDASGGNTDHICSPAFLYPLVNGGVDEGANTQYVVARLNDYGCASLALKPYSDTDYTSWPSEQAWVNALEHRTRSSYAIYTDEPDGSGVRCLKQHLANGHTAVTRFTVYESFLDYPTPSVGTIDNGVYYADAGGILGGHAVAVVGYDDSKSYTDGRDGVTYSGAFLCANSWGPSWGVANTTGSTGFFWVAYRAFYEYYPATFGLYAFFNSDREDYHPSLYAVIGVNHAQRGKVALRTGIEFSPQWYSHFPFCFDGGNALPVTDADRVAVDMTDGVPPDGGELTVSGQFYVAIDAGASGTITSAEFHQDLDGDGDYFVHTSADPTVTVDPDRWGYAYATIHRFSVTTAPPSPSTVTSGGATQLDATFSDGASHTVASWSWDDGGAGGAFSPSATVQNPTYTAPANPGESNLTITLTVSATCSGASAVSDDDRVTLTVLPAEHTFSVTANRPEPRAVASGGSASLSATCADSRGHAGVSWSWDDGGAGGHFSDAGAQTCTYTAHDNSTGSDLLITLTVQACCDGAPSLCDSDTTTLTVSPDSHVFSVTAYPPDPNPVASGGQVMASASAMDSQGHGAISWHWDDGGAGGTFYPSADLQHTTYTAPANTSDDPLVITLTVSAACDGPTTLDDSDSTVLTVNPVAHTFQITITADPVLVYSGGWTQLRANPTDTRGHCVTSYQWSDGGAGGVFLPSPEVENPIYIAPENTGGSDWRITLSLDATCDGLQPITDNDWFWLTIRPTSAEAEVYVEVWRSRLGYPRAIAVDAADGSLWVANGASVTHLTADWEELSPVRGFPTTGFRVPCSLSVAQGDRSCWAADSDGGQVVHLAADGTELWRGHVSWPLTVSADPADGSCWVAGGSRGGPGWGSVIHFGADGAVLSRLDGLYNPKHVSVNETDGSCWAEDAHTLLHFARDGTMTGSYWTGMTSPVLAANPNDGSVWAGDPYTAQLTHFAADGSEIWWIPWPVEPVFVAVNPSDDTCWVADHLTERVLHIAENGMLLGQSAALDANRDFQLAVDRGNLADPTDDSCWVVATGSSGNRSVVHLDADCAELARFAARGYNRPSVNSGDNTCWAIDGYTRQPVHFSADGQELWRGAMSAEWVSVDSQDDSCWVTSGQSLLHLAPNGDERCSVPFAGTLGPISVAGDSSCWASVAVFPGVQQMVRVAPDCSEVCRVEAERWYNPGSVSADPLDNSCWVADTRYDQVAHITDSCSRGDPVGGFYTPVSVAVSPVDSSVWVVNSSANQVIHLDESGNELCRVPAGDIQWPDCVSADSDGSCWVDSFSDVVHVAPDCTVLSRSGWFDGPAFLSVNQADHSLWVEDGGNNQLAHLVRGHALSLNGYGGSVRVNGVLYELPWTGTFAHSAEVTLEAVPDAGITFLRWSGSYEGADNPIHIAVNERVDITAMFDAPACTLNLTGEGCGAVWVNGVERPLPWSDMFYYGAVVTLEAVPCPDSHFMEWTGDLIITDNPTSVTMTSAKSITAGFAINTYTLSLAGSHGTVKVKSVSQALPYSGSFSHGDVVALEAVPNSGYAFTSWSGDLTGTTNPTTVTMNDHKNITVGFALHTLAVTASCLPTTVASGGATSLTGGFTDSIGTHGIATWSWSDGGAGGSFAPSASVQNPSYTAPANLTDSDVTVTLAVTATCDGPSPLTASDTTTLTVQPVGHTLSVDASCAPATVASGGVSSLSASFSDSRSGHGIATWNWEDGGAGGSFAPSASVQNPSYTAPANLTDSDVTVTLAVTATCDGPSPLTESDACTLTVQPVSHTLSVGASCAPSTVASGGSTTLSASATDSRSGHGVATWSWSDGGAGGSFSPSTSAQNPSYTAPANLADDPIVVTLTVSATCDGPSPLADTDSASLTVNPANHSLTVGAACLPSTVASGGTTSLGGSATDSRGHAVSTWAWDDGGAGGSFSPSASAQSPTYTAAANTTDSDRTVTLTVTARCGGPSPISNSDSCALTVQPVGHTLSVEASCVPSTVASGGTSSLTASATDSRTGHAVSSWQWDDGGAGGTFSLSSSAQNPSYTAPRNTTGSDLLITLTVHATCDGSVPASGSDAVALTVHTAAPAADFSGTPTRGKLPLEVGFTDLSANAPTSWAWDFGDGGTSASQNPRHTYASVGSYTVSLTATNAGGPNTKHRPWYVKVSFLDVAITPVDAADHWALNYILACVNAGIVGGYGDGTYRPELPVDRAAMAVFIARAIAGGDGLVPDGSTTATFPDVPATHWAFKYVEYAHAQNVVGGYWDGTYRPTLTVTRDQMAVFVARAMVAPAGDAAIPPGPETPTFPDVPTDHWAYKWVEYCHGHSVVGGYWDGTYRPDEVVDRGAMAVFVQRAFELPM